MKSIISHVFLTILLGCTSNKNNLHHKFFEDDVFKGDFIPVDTLFIDINLNNRNDQVIVFREKEWNDPGDFQKLILHFDSGAIIELFNTGDWIGKPEFIEISKGRVLLLIDGYGYASSPQKYTIIDINEQNPKNLTFEQFDLEKIEDLDNDGVKELIGRNYYSECYKDYDSISSICSYAPFFVYGYQNDAFIVNDSLTAEYNYKNYVGYFGNSDPNDRYEIVTPNYKYRNSMNPFFLNMVGRKLPESSLRYLRTDELLNFSKSDLRLIRNEIFAFHGYVFESDDLKEYFNQQSWYKPIGKEVTKSLNKFEKQNIELISSLEQ